MVSRRWTRAWVAASLVAAALLAPAPARARQSGEVTARARPAKVRVGDTFVVTVRATGPGRPDTVELGAVDGAEVVDVRERTSWSVGPRGSVAVTEAEFTLRALGVGRVSPRRAVAVRSGDSTWVDVPDVSSVAAPLTRPEPAPRRARDGAETPVRPEGVPPWGSGRTGVPPYPWSGATPPGASGIPSTPAVPYGTVYGQGGSALPYPYGQGGGSQPYPYGPTGYPGGGPYGVSGWGAAPPGRGWAATADSDPSWFDLIPRLERYQSDARDSRGLVTLEAGMTPERVYEGQQATLVATATFAPEALARLGPGTELFPPSPSNAWSVEIPYAPPSPSATGGRLEEAHTLMRAFFPVSPGSFDVEGVRLRYTVGSGGAAYTPGEELATGPLSVEVVPIPRDGAPPGWGGAVGRFRVAAWIQPEAVRWGEAAFLTVEVAGAGNVQTIPRPDPGPVWGAELRPVGERAMVEVRDGVVGGAKTFTWLVVPAEAAQVRVGPVIYSFFDPWIGDFGQVASGELVLDVQPLPGDAGGGSSASEAPAPPGPPSATPGGDGAPEAEARAALGALEERPHDPELWLTLASAYGAARPGEGWAEWALRNGLVWAPRDRSVRSALWGSAAWPGWREDVPALPLSPRESLSTALALAAAALGAAAWGAPRRARGHGWAALALGLALASGGALAAEPWARQAAIEARAIVVAGPVTPRSAPSWDAPPRDRPLPGGAPVALRRRFGSWVEVADADGASGWVETAQVARLDPASAR